MNRRRFGQLLLGSLVALPAAASAKLVECNPCKELPLAQRDRPPYRGAPLMVLPREAGYSIGRYRRAYGHLYWVVTDDRPVRGYRADGVVLFGFTGMSKSRLERVYERYATRCRPGYKVEHW